MEFKTVAVSELEGAALDWAVAEAVGLKSIILSKNNPEEKWQVQKQDYQGGPWWPSQNWSQCGPLIEKYSITVADPSLMLSGLWEAFINCYGLIDAKGNADLAGSFEAHGETLLKAACRVIVTAKLGKEVNIPVSLIGATYGAP